MYDKFLEEVAKLEEARQEAIVKAIEKCEAGKQSAFEVYAKELEAETKKQAEEAAAFKPEEAIVPEVVEGVEIKKAKKAKKLTV